MKLLRENLWIIPFIIIVTIFIIEVYFNFKQTGVIDMNPPI